MIFLSGRLGGSGDGTAVHNKCIGWRAWGAPVQDFKRSLRRANQDAIAAFTPLQKENVARCLAAGTECTLAQARMLVEYIVANGGEPPVEYDGTSIHVYLN